ncbi:MAG: hypothetical protein IJ611_09595 [Bacteroidales bacterium]|nr:hypothetical protein [Bacteroidales bacterium]
MNVESIWVTHFSEQKLDWMQGQYVELSKFTMLTSPNDQTEDTYFRVKKYMPTVAYDGAEMKTLYKIWYRAKTSALSNEVKTADRSDVIPIRYADVLLMLDELQGSVDGMNQLRRWYPKDAGKIVNDNQVGCYVENKGKVVPGGWKNLPGTSIEQRYNETRGFWMIPSSQIVLSEGVLEQTPGWTDGFNHYYEGNLPY